MNRKRLSRALGQLLRQVADAYDRSDSRELWSKVYLIQAGENGPIKIGWARDVAERRKALQIGNHVELSVAFELPGDQATERAFHDVLYQDRIRGEWFAWSKRTRAIVKLLARAESDNRQVTQREMVTDLREAFLR